jgi:hypothetical protein
VPHLIREDGLSTNTFEIHDLRIAAGAFREGRRDADRCTFLVASSFTYRAGVKVRIVFEDGTFGEVYPTSTGSNGDPTRSKVTATLLLRKTAGRA